jgi:hypothetical protein
MVCAIHRFCEGLPYNFVLHTPLSEAPSKAKERAVVEFDYLGEQSDELSLKMGEVITILERDVNEGWSKGELNGKVGLFPDNFVKMLPPEQAKKVM